MPQPILLTHAVSMNKPDARVPTAATALSATADCAIRVFIALLIPERFVSVLTGVGRWL